MAASQQVPMTAIDRTSDMIAATKRAVDAQPRQNVPDCTTPAAATVAGILAAAVMAGEINIGSPAVPPAVWDRLRNHVGPDVDFAAYAEGFRVAGLMTGARARASVRTPDHAAISAAEAALALAEDALDAATHDMIIDAAGEGFLASIRDTLRAGLAPRHAAEGHALQP